MRLPALPAAPAIAPGLALLPLRLFLGGTFVYAGIEKLLDPGFLAKGAPTYIGSQLEAFADGTPGGAVLRALALPLPEVAGVGVALFELAIGLLAVLGLLTRAAALAGLGLSTLLFLTASWKTRPYFLGPDLVFAFAWLPFALAGAASTGDGTVSAPWSVVVSSPRRGYGRLLLDGHRWPAAVGRAIIPAGSHTLQWLRGADGFPALERLQGELKDESTTASSLRVAYSADATAWCVVNRRPVSLALDGASSALVAVPNPSGGYTVRLPRGTHDAKLSF
jgi:thiosulfate dehydrogenase [quinone] large subunit